MIVRGTMLHVGWLIHVAPLLGYRQLIELSSQGTQRCSHLGSLQSRPVTRYNTLRLQIRHSKSRGAASSATMAIAGAACENICFLARE